LLDPVSNGISPITQSKKWSVYPRPTQPFGFGRSLLNHSLGFSVQPAAITTTLASSVACWPVSPTRQVTPRAVVAPSRTSVWIWVTKASAISVTALPCFDQRFAVSAIGM
jgi:hypothetical protein